MDLGIDNEKDEKKFLEIVNEEEKHVKEFIQRSNLEILDSECEKLALVYWHSADVFHEAEKDLKQIQAKKATKFQQKKAQIKFNTLKRQRNKVLARLHVISSHIGKHDVYFVDDATGNTSTKGKDKAQKIELAKMAAQALVHEEEQRRAQEQAKKEKQRKGKKVVHFNLRKLIIPACFQSTSSLPFPFHVMKI